MQKRNVHIFRAGNFTLLNGAILPNLEVAYETYGSAANAEKRTILLLHGYTSNPHAAGGSDLDPGWWENLIGPGRAIDTEPLLCRLAEYARIHLQDDQSRKYKSGH